MEAGAGFLLKLLLGVSGARNPNQLYRYTPGSTAPTDVLIPAQRSEAAKMVRKGDLLIQLSLSRRHALMAIVNPDREYTRH